MQHVNVQVPEMPAKNQDWRKSEMAGSRDRRRELFREEDVKLQWSTVRKAVSVSHPRTHVKPACQHASHGSAFGADLIICIYVSSSIMSVRTC